MQNNNLNDYLKITITIIIILMNKIQSKNAEEVVRNYEQEQEHTHIVN